MARSRATAAGWLLAPLLLLDATPGHAHAVGLSRGEYRSDDAQVRADLAFSRKELVASFPGLDADHDGQLTEQEFSEGRSGLSDWIRRGVLVRNRMAPCEGTVHELSLTEQDGITIHAVFDCPSPVGGFTVRWGLFHELSVGHRHLASAAVESPAATPLEVVLYESQPEFEFTVSRAQAEVPTNVAPSLFRLGFEHILGGPDHLLFLFALILVAAPLRSLLASVSAFTLAHSITLAVAALGVWSPRPLLVEPAIALSIAFVGIENFVVADLSRRWRLTFAFGLIHGFGFAGALREISLPASELPLALASFNIGVEAGQLAVLAVVLPAVWWLQQRRWFAHGGFQTSSVAIAVMGLWWFVARVASG